MGGQAAAFGRIPGGYLRENTTDRRGTAAERPGFPRWAARWNERACCRETRTSVPGFSRQCHGKLRAGGRAPLIRMAKKMLSWPSCVLRRLVTRAPHVTLSQKTGRTSGDQSVESFHPGFLWKDCRSLRIWREPGGGRGAFPSGCGASLLPGGVAGGQVHDRDLIGGALLGFAVYYL